MKPVTTQIPRRQLLGSDPEPLGTERYTRLMSRVGAHRETPRRAVTSVRLKAH